MNPLDFFRGPHLSRLSKVLFMCKSLSNKGLPCPYHPSRISLVPLLAYDTRGGRLGYGQGHYDRTAATFTSLPQKKPLFIGYALSIQCIERVLTDAHDHPLQAVVTEKEVTFF